MKTKLALLAAVVLIVGHVVAEDRTRAKSPTDGLVGTYTITAGERNGSALPNSHYKDVTVRFAANAVTTFVKDNKELYAATYSVDTNAKPWKIRMTATITPKGGIGTVAEGLIHKDGDTLTLIYALPNGKAPTALKTHENQQMFTLTRTK